MIVKVSAIYHPGAIEHFSRQPVDHWQQMNDALESQWKEAPFEMREVLCDSYFVRATELLSAYRISVPKVREITPLDGFMMGERRVDARISGKEKYCYKCQGFEGIGFEKIPGKTEVRLTCGKCKSKK